MSNDEDKNKNNSLSEGYHNFGSDEEVPERMLNIKTNNLKGIYPT